MALAITGGSGSISDPYIIDNPGSVVGEDLIGHSSIVWPGRYSFVHFQFSVGMGAGAWTVALATTSHITLRGRDTDTTSGWDAEDTTGGNNEISITVQTSDSILLELIQFSEPAPSSIRLTITAPAGLSDPTTIDVSAGGDRTISSGATIDLAGSADIVNPSGPTTYAWTRVSGVGGALSSVSIATPTFVAPSLVAGGSDRDIVWRLTVTNNGVSDSDDVSVTVVAGAALVTTVTASAGADKAIASGEDASLDGSAVVINPSGDTAYAWTRVSGIGGALSSAAIAIPTFTAPVLADGADDVVIVWRLTATNNGVSDTDDVTATVTAAAVIVAPPIGDALYPDGDYTLIEIGGINITGRCYQKSLKITRSQGEKSTCKILMYARQDPVSTDPRDHVLTFEDDSIWEFESGGIFELSDKTLSDVVMRLGDTRISLLNTAEIRYTNNRVIFGGYVWKATRTPLENDLQDANVNVTLTGFETSLRNQFIEAPITVSGTLKQAVTDILAANPVVGLMVGNIPDVDIEDISFRNITIYRAFQQMATAYNLGMAVDASNTLKFIEGGASTSVLFCDLDAYDAADPTVYTRILVDEITLSTTASNYANRVVLNSSDILGLSLISTVDSLVEQEERGIVSRSIDAPGPYTQNTLNALANSLITSYSRHPVRFNIKTIRLDRHDDDVLLTLSPGDAVHMNIAGAVNTLSGVPSQLFIESLVLNLSDFGPEGIYHATLVLSSQILNPVYSDAWGRD